MVERDIIFPVDRQLSCCRTTWGNSDVYWGFRDFILRFIQKIDCHSTCVGRSKGERYIYFFSCVHLNLLRR